MHISAVNLRNLHNHFKRYYIKQIMSYSDDDLRNAVNAVFDAYDKDKSGTLEANEITQLINDALKHMGQGRQVTQQEVNQFIAAVDKNNDGKIAKPELFEIFKRVVSHK